MIYTTLNRIRSHHPCMEGWRTLLSHLGKTEADDSPLALATVLESNGLEDALWCLRSVPEESSRWRKLAVAYARTVQHLMTDPRSLAALDVAERHADGLATDDELEEARREALEASDAATDVARTAWAASAPTAPMEDVEEVEAATRKAWAALAAAWSVAEATTNAETWATETVNHVQIFLEAME